MTDGRDLLNAPLGDIIRDVALAIADAQTALDAASMRTAEFMSGRVMRRDPDTGELVEEVDAQGRPTGVPAIDSSEVIFGHDIDDEGQRVPQLRSMMELGFVPTFYQFVDTTITMNLSVRLTGSGSSQNRYTSRGTAWGMGERHMIVHASTVDAGFASAYGYSAELATTVSTKLVPIPPPAALDDLLARNIASAAEDRVAPASEPEFADARLDLNTATLTDLQEIDGLGPARAQAIIDHREANGPFASVADLMNVPGIPEATLQHVATLVRVDSA